MDSMLNLMVGMWTHVGPGLLFAVALPLMLVLFGAVARTGYRRARNR
jgi:hypothetical protein